MDIAGMSTYSTRPERPSNTPESFPGTEPILAERNPLPPDEWIVAQSKLLPASNVAVGTGNLFWSRGRLDAVSMPPLDEESHLR